MIKMKIGIVVSEYNYDITYLMLERAKEHAKFLNAEIAEIIKTPGVFEVPLAVKKLLARKDINGVVTLGAVIEGETQHDEVIMQHAARKIIDLGIEYSKPVGLGISGPGMSRLQALERIEKAKEAVESVVKMCQRLKD
ncbi:MAG: 6,7-dimethyl-8-ribityllumazine synthase [Candidatus Thermoplasmatota archaeon]